MAVDTDWINGSSDAVILFGVFRLLPKQRLLMQLEKPVHLGGRAFDVLIALLERPGELVSKEELIARVWPNRFVGPANLAVHISALRRALGDGRDGNRYVVNIPGRGYRFVAPVTVIENQKQAPLVDEGSLASIAQSVWRAELEGFAAQIARLVTNADAGRPGNAGLGLAIPQQAGGRGESGALLVDDKACDEP